MNLTVKSNESKFWPLLWSIGPFATIAITGFVLFFVRRRFCRDDSPDRQPLEEYVTYNPSTGSVVFSLSNSRSSIANPTYGHSQNPPDGPPSYENSMRDSTFTLDHENSLPMSGPPTGRPLPSVPSDTRSIFSSSSATYEPEPE